MKLDKATATGEHAITLTPGKGEKPWLWTVRILANGTWTAEVLPGWLRSHRLPSAAFDRVVVTAGIPFDTPGTTNLLKVETV